MAASELYSKHARVWLPHHQDVWQPAELTRNYTPGDKSLHVLLEDGTGVEIKMDPKGSSLPPLRNPNILVGENDLTALSYLHEPAVLHNLTVRFMDSKMIYTYCGIVLVAINPYESLPIYDVDLIAAYSGQNMSDMDPHIFAVTEEAYRRMASDDRNQSIIVSGESGAGKTVSAKYAMRYFATVSGTSTESSIEQRVLASNPIMEAIGNAKTTRNDNSSRFGKYIQIGFDKKHHIIGANMRTYLLEKSRVVFQANRERNYHIFYQLCASSHLPEFKDFRLSGAEDFLCTNQGQSCLIDGVDDAKQLVETRNALSLLGISVVEQMALFQTLASVLHLSNMEVVEQSADKSSISAEDVHLAVFCELAGVPRGDMSHWLCHRKLRTATETFVKPVSRADAVAGRDALAKWLYSRLFSLVVDRINHNLMSSSKTHSFIGILDIYGFETFDINSFEQFCINYANEKLQQQFNLHVFKLEQEEYMSENINWTLIDFYDNQQCIGLIEDRMGILDLLDEECKMPKGSDVSWAQKLYNTLLKQNAAHFDKPRMSNTAFIIQHFADKVEYQCDGFLEKNKDTVNEEHINLLNTSKWDFLLVLLEDESKTAACSTPSPSSSSRTSRSGPAQRGHKKTVGLQFKQSLHMLMEILNSTTPHYIRCIKPNDDKAAFILNPVRVVQQLRACGILETIRISAAGFPSRWTYQEFFNRYRVLVKWKDVLTDRKQTCRNLLANCLKDEEKYQFGKSKIFFRAGQVAYLEKQRSDALRTACVRIQKTIRCWLGRKKYLRMRRAAVTVQRHVRGHQARCLARFMRRTNASVLIQQMVRMWLARKRYRRQRSAAISIQCCYRAYRAKQHYYKLVYEHKAVVIQRFVRGWLARRHCARYVGAVVLLQSCVRRWRALRELRRLKAEARSVEHFKKLNVGMENKIMQLQRKLDKQHKENAQLGERLAVAERHQGVQRDALVGEMERLRAAELEARAQLEDRLPSLLNEVAFLRHEAEEARREKQDVEQVAVAYSEHAQQVVDQLNEEILVLKGQKADLDTLVQEQKQKITAMEASVEHSKHVEKDLTGTQSRYQSLMREHLELQEEMNRSKNAGRRDSFYSDSTEGAEGEDSSSSSLHKQDGDVSVLLKFQKRVKEVEQEKQALQRQLDRREGSQQHKDKEVEDQTSSIRAELDLEVLKRRDLESDNRHLKRDLKELRESLSSAATPPSPGSLPYSVLLEQLNSSSEELEMRKEEVLILRSHMVHQEALKHKDLVLGEGLRLDHHDITSLQDFDRSADLHTLNEDGELWLAYEGLKETNRVLEEQLQEQTASHREESEEQLEQMRRLKEDNERQRQLLDQGLVMSQEARVDAGLQHEITCLANDNLILMEQREKQDKNLRKLYKQLKIYRRRVDELEARPQTSSSSAISPVNITRKEKDFKGMLEFRDGDEKRLVKHLVIDLRPRGVAVNMIPGLPAFVLFMCLRFVDHTDDPQRVSALLNATVSGIKHVIKRKGDDFETMSFWLANTCRFLHCIKQYSGKEVFSKENTARQNEHCLLNFELSEYEQVFSDLATRLYQQLCTCIEADLQKLIVSGMLEHDAVQGLMGSKPHLHSAAASSSSPQEEQQDLTMESLLSQLSVFLSTLQSHGLQTDLVHQLTRQMFYLIGSVSLNHLLLHKHMCCWNTGLQIKYNVLQLEEWLAEKQLSDCGAKQALEGLIQTAQLLQAKKNTQEDAVAVGTICSVLTTAQIVRMLTQYTPVMEFEERVSHSFISNIQAILKDRVGSPLFLMDVKKVFPVSWTYTWSPVALDSIHIPASLNLGFLNLV